MSDGSQGKVLVGFGFGAIQGGLFFYEAFRTGRFSRLVVAEVMPDVVAAVRSAGGSYGLNIATVSGLKKCTVNGVEILNPNDVADRGKLLDAVAAADEIATALPSVDFFDKGGAVSVAAILAEGLARKPASHRCIVYTAENNNHAAELLVDRVQQVQGADADAIHRKCDFLNTVIGKMSGVVTDPEQIREQGLVPVVPGGARAFLVEEFNRILISRIRWPEFDRGIAAFDEKPDLLPFEEAKLYGHNAVHALIGYCAKLRGYRYVSDATGDKELMRVARMAFIDESGKALCRKYHGLDRLFTEDGFKAYADDLLVRMMNPHLRDAVERVTRDPRRKLGWDDRLVGTMRLALEQGIEPASFATGVAAALRGLAGSGGSAECLRLLDDVWGRDNSSKPAADRIRDLVTSALTKL